MNEQASDQDLRDSIEPNSDQLNADDLLAGPITVTIRDVIKGPSVQQKIEITIDGHRPFRPCLSMRRVLIACWGDKRSEWIGRSMTLYCDPAVKFGTSAVGGVRISHLSHIASSVTVMLTISRGKKAPFTVKPLANSPAAYPAAEFKANVGVWVAAVKSGKLTIPGVISRAAAKGALTSEQITKIEDLVEAGEATPSESQQPGPIPTESMHKAVETATTTDELDEVLDLANSLDKDSGDYEALKQAIDAKRATMTDEA